MAVFRRFVFTLPAFLSCLDSRTHKRKRPRAPRHAGTSPAVRPSGPTPACPHVRVSACPRVRVSAACAPRLKDRIPPLLVSIIQYFAGIVNMWNKKNYFTFLEKTPMFQGTLGRNLQKPSVSGRIKAKSAKSPCFRAHQGEICKKPTFLYTFASTRRAMASARCAPSFSTPSRYALSASKR